MHSATCPICKAAISSDGPFKPVNLAGVILCGRTACSAQLESDRLDADLEGDRDYQAAKRAERKGGRP